MLEPLFNTVCKIAILLIILVESVLCARILGVFPTPNLSHQIVFRPLMLELAFRGHEVVVITTDPVYPRGDGPPNFIEIDMHNISYPFWRAQLAEVGKGKQNDIFSQTDAGRKMLFRVFEEQFTNDAVQNLLKDKNVKFDLIFAEAYFRMVIGLTHLWNCPLILISSLGATYTNYDVVGAPSHPLLYPGALRQRIVNMSFTETLYELYADVMFTNQVYDSENLHNGIIQKLFPGTPKLSELEKNVNMLFLNTNPLWEGIRPVPLSVAYTLGIYHKHPQNLPQDIQSLLDASKHGVIYMSFGTIVNTSNLPKELIQMFMHVFSQQPYDVLWKWDQDELQDKPKNIHIAKWWPQSDLLRHPKVKLFINHGGLLSIQESINAGVPMISMPLIFDQWSNAENSLKFGIGKKLEIASITSEKFTDAITSVIGDESYRQNIMKLRSLLYDQPISPLGRAVWWTEYMLRHKKARHLIGPAADVSWIEYYEIELVLTVLSICIVFVIAVVSLLRLLIRKTVAVVKYKTL